MSTKTDADEYIDSAIASIKYAITGLSKVVVEQCYGHDEYSRVYRETIQTAFHTLIGVRDSLAGERR